MCFLVYSHILVTFCNLILIQSCKWNITQRNSCCTSFLLSYSHSSWWCCGEEVWYHTEGRVSFGGIHYFQERILETNLSDHFFFSAVPTSLVASGIPLVFVQGVALQQPVCLNVLICGISSPALVCCFCCLCQLLNGLHHCHTEGNKILYNQKLAACELHHINYDVIVSYHISEVTVIHSFIFYCGYVNLLTVDMNEAL